MQPTHLQPISQYTQTQPMLMSGGQSNTQFGPSTNLQGQSSLSSLSGPQNGTSYPSPSSQTVSMNHPSIQGTQYNQPSPSSSGYTQSGYQSGQMQTSGGMGSQMHTGTMQLSGPMQSNPIQNTQMQTTGMTGQMQSSQMSSTPGGSSHRGSFPSMSQPSQFFGSFQSQQSYDSSGGYPRSEGYNTSMGMVNPMLKPTQSMFVGSSSQGGYQLPSSSSSKPRSIMSADIGRRTIHRRTVVTRSRDQNHRSSQGKASCFPFSREGKQNAVKKFDPSQIAEILFVSYGVPLDHEELIELDESPDAQPKANTPELKRVFEIIFRFWNSQYGRLAYFPRAPFDNNCGALWIGKSLESVAYADVTDAHIPSAAFVSAKWPKPKVEPPKVDPQIDPLANGTF